MLEFEIDISDAIAGLHSAKAALENLKPALKEAGLYMERETRLNIARQTSPDGTPFAPLAASTLRTKKSGRILQETSAMVNSISTRAAKKSVKVGTSIGYAAYHQFGTRKMPARPFLGIEERHHEPIIKIVEDHLRKAIA